MSGLVYDNTGNLTGEQIRYVHACGCVEYWIVFNKLFEPEEVVGQYDCPTNCVDIESHKKGICKLV